MVLLNRCTFLYLIWSLTLFNPKYRVLDCVNCSLLVLVAPTITNMPDTVAVSEGSDAQLPCVSVGNPSTLFTNWTRHGESLTSHPRFPVLEKGSLLIKKVRRTDAGEYTCTPHNKVGAGVSKTTKLVLKGKSNCTRTGPPRIKPINH